jgi:hypothetical protein
MQPRTAAAGLVVLFLSIAALMLLVMPKPHGPADYMIAGSVATFVTLGVALLLFLLQNADLRATFFGRKRKSK